MSVWRVGAVYILHWHPNLWFNRKHKHQTLVMKMKKSFSCVQTARERASWSANITLTTAAHPLPLTITTTFGAFQFFRTRSKLNAVCR